jgi:hypothetical protein
VPQFKRMTAYRRPFLDRGRPHLAVCCRIKFQEAVAHRRTNTSFAMNPYFRQSNGLNVANSAELVCITQLSYPPTRTSPLNLSSTMTAFDAAWFGARCAYLNDVIGDAWPNRF